MADFQKASGVLLLAEGGYSNSASDRGGETKYGISKRSYPHIDIKNLTVDVALTILKRDFWDTYHIGSINDQAIATRVLLLFVNTGPRDAAKIVQDAVNEYGIDTPLIVDGYMGPVTFAAINQLSFPQHYVSILRLQECRYYLGLVDLYPSQLANLRGWIRRAVNG